MKTIELLPGYYKIKAVKKEDGVYLYHISIKNKKSGFHKLKGLWKYHGAGTEGSVFVKWS